MNAKAPRAASIEAAVLDFGNVLVEVDFRRAFASWAAAAGTSVDALSRRFAFDDAYCAHERGEMDASSYFSCIRNSLQVEIPDKDLLEGWNAIFGEPLPGAGRVLRELAARMPVYVFSNTNLAHLGHFAPRYRELLAPVKKVVTSCEIGARKPEAEAFRRMAAIAGLPPARLAFFDDLEENVAGARRAGLQAHRVSRPEEILRLL